MHLGPQHQHEHLVPPVPRIASSDADHFSDIHEIYRGGAVLEIQRRDYRRPDRVRMPIDRVSGSNWHRQNPRRRDGEAPALPDVPNQSNERPAFSNWQA
jgi:hypothetical protein